MKPQYLLSITITTILFNLSIGSIQTKYHQLRKQEHKLNEITCGEIQDEYTPMDITSIGAQSANQKVMVSYYINNAKENPGCTAMACTDVNPCCNGCGTTPKFDNINLIPSSGDMVIGCGGSNCDYKEHCIYDDGDRILVYGTVNSFGWTIVVDQHCLDPKYTSELNSVEEKEDNVTHIDNEQEDQYSIWGSYSTNYEEDERCKELNNEFMLPGTAYCMMVLGVGIYNGECTYISGCSENGHEFFSSKQECKLTCGLNVFQKKNEFDPTLSILPPNATSHYIPYEGIHICIRNTLYKSIHLPGCSVFSLLAKNDSTVSYPECNEDNGNENKTIAQELQPGEEYCSEYNLNFYKSGEYIVSAQYCRNINTYTTSDPPIFHQDCNDIYTIESETYEISCPETVDCLPFVPQPLWLVCGSSRNFFVDQCENTTILD